MTERRPVRVDTQFFSELDTQLGVTRGPHGEPSASDALLIDLPSFADQFADQFELPAMYPTGGDYRDLVTIARLVAAVLVVPCWRVASGARPRGKPVMPRARRQHSPNSKDDRWQRTRFRPVTCAV